MPGWGGLVTATRGTHAGVHGLVEAPWAPARGGQARQGPVAPAAPRFVSHPLPGSFWASCRGPRLAQAPWPRPALFLALAIRPVCCARFSPRLGMLDLDGGHETRRAKGEPDRWGAEARVHTPADVAAASCRSTTFVVVTDVQHWALQPCPCCRTCWFRPEPGRGGSSAEALPGPSLRTTLGRCLGPQAALDRKWMNRSKCGT